MFTQISCTKLLPLLECQKLNFVRPFAKLKLYPLSEIQISHGTSLKAKIIYRQNKNLTVLVSKKIERTFRKVKLPLAILGNFLAHFQVREFRP